MGGRRAEERLFDARDAYSSATVLALLTLAVAVLFASAQRHLSPPLAVSVIRGFLAGCSLGLLGVAWATRRAPREWIAFVYCVLIAVGYAVLIPLSALHWQHVYRPWEAFVGPQLAIASVSLMLPRSLWFGAAALLVFVAETFAVYFYFVSSTATGALLPVGEPYSSLSFVAVSVGILVLRHLRRRSVLDHLRRAGAAAAVQATACQLRDVSGIIGERASELRRLCETLPASASAQMRDTVARSVHRIAVVGGELARVSLGRGGAAEEKRHAEEGERLLYAETAHGGATVAAAVVALLGLIAGFVFRHPAVFLVRVVDLGVGVVAFALFCFLLATRRRPSEVRATFIFVVLTLLLLAAVTLGQYRWPATNRVFEPLLGTKLLLLLLPMVLPRRIWVGYAVELAVAAHGIALYYVLHSRWGHAVPLTEPWVTSLYGLIGVALLVMREHRRVTSVQLLRADRDVAALVAQTRTSLRALDSLGSPLQTLTLEVEMLGVGDADLPTIRAMRSAIAHISEATERLPSPDTVASSYLGPSIDRDH
jgi:hypothetical protein